MFPRMAGSALGLRRSEQYSAAADVHRVSREHFRPCPSSLRGFIDHISNDRISLGYRPLHGGTAPFISVQHDTNNNAPDRLNAEYCPTYPCYYPLASTKVPPVAGRPLEQRRTSGGKAGNSTLQLLAMALEATRVICAA